MKRVDLIRHLLVLQEIQWLCCVVFTASGCIFRPGPRRPWCPVASATYPGKRWMSIRDALKGFYHRLAPMDSTPFGVGDHRWSLTQGSLRQAQATLG